MEADIWTRRLICAFSDPCLPFFLAIQQAAFPGSTLSQNDYNSLQSPLGRNLFFCLGEMGQKCSKMGQKWTPQPMLGLKIEFPWSSFLLYLSEFAVSGRLGQGCGRGTPSQGGGGGQLAVSLVLPSPIFPASEVVPSQGSVTGWGRFYFLLFFFLECTLHPASIQTRCMVELNCCPGLKQYA